MINHDAYIDYQARQVPANVRSIEAPGASPAVAQELGSQATPWAVEVHPYEGPAVEGASNNPVATASSVQGNCVHVGLTGEHIVSADLLRAGHQKQTTFVELTFDPMPAVCHGLYRRIDQVADQIKVNNKWRDMSGWGAWWYSRDAGTGDFHANFADTPTGHEGPWIYWRNGEKVRALFWNKVINLKTHKVVGQKRFSAPVTPEPNS